KASHILKDTKCKALFPVARAHTWDRVEWMAVVNTQHSENRQEYTCTYTCRTSYLEWIDFGEFVPGITCFCKSQHEYSGLLIKHHRVSQLNLVLAVNRAT